MHGQVRGAVDEKGGGQTEVHSWRHAEKCGD